MSPPMTNPPSRAEMERLADAGELIARARQHLMRCGADIRHAAMLTDFARQEAIRSLPDAREALEPTDEMYEDARLAGQLMETYHATGDKVFWMASKRLAKLSPASPAAPPPSPQAGESELRALVDWTYLHATEGDAWPGQSTIEQLIAKAKIGPPTQADADVYRKAQPTKAGESREAIIEALEKIAAFADQPMLKWNESQSGEECMYYEGYHEGLRAAGKNAKAALAAAHQRGEAK